MGESQEERASRFRKRGSTHLSAGVGIGLLAGVILGLSLGLVAFSGRAGALAAASLGGAIFGGIVGALVGGYSSLESPEPGREPTDTQRPIADRPAMTRREGEPTGDAPGNLRSGASDT